MIKPLLAVLLLLVSITFQQVAAPMPIVLTDVNGNLSTPFATTTTAQKTGNPVPVVITDANGNVLTISSPKITQLTSQYTNSTTGFTNVAGGNTMQFTAAANTNYTMSCHLFYQAASTGGLNIEFTGPASPTAVSYGLNLPVSATTSGGNGVATAYSTSLGSVVTTAATNFDAIVSFALQNGANAGIVNLLAKSSAAVQLQIQVGSYCVVQ